MNEDSTLSPSTLSHIRWVTYGLPDNGVREEGGSVDP